MSRLAVALALLALTPAALAQRTDAPPEPAADGVYEVAEVQPELVGGLAALQERVAYPASAREEGIEGTVVVQFTVREDGVVTDPAVLRTPDPRLADAALAAIEGSTFTAGSVGGRAVPVRVAVPLSFRLSGSESASSPVFWEVEYSDNVERLVDRRETQRAASWARMMSSVAYEGEAFEGLAPGSAEVRFTVSEEGRATEIEVSEASSPVVERFARFQALAARFAPEAVGESGTLSINVTRVGR